MQLIKPEGQDYSGLLNIRLAWAFRLTPALRTTRSCSIYSNFSSVGFAQWPWSAVPLSPQCSRLGTSLRDAGTPLVVTSRADGQGEQSTPYPQTALPKEGAVSHTRNASVIWNPIKMDPLAIILPSPKAVALLKITHTSSCLWFPQARPNYPVIGIFSSLLGKTGKIQARQRRGYGSSTTVRASRSTTTAPTSSPK